MKRFIFSYTVLNFNMFLFLEPPVIDAFSFENKKLGDRIVVTCAVKTGDQPLHIVWTKDGEVIPPDLGIQVQVYMHWEWRKQKKGNLVIQF